MTLQDIPLPNLLRLTLALILYPAPGLLAVILARKRIAFNTITSLFISYTFSAGFYAFLFVWLLPVKSIKINQWELVALAVICYTAIVYVLTRRKGAHPGPREKGATLVQFAYLIVFLLIFFAYLWPARHFVAGMGSDSMHHTLIVQMIVQNGRLPDNYLPLFDIVTFRYHFGYHLAGAIASMLSGVSPRLIVLLSGPLLVASASLSAGLLTETLTKNRIAGLVASALVGMGMIFPGYMITWGRFPQLAALTCLAITLLVVYRITVTNKTVNVGSIILISVLAVSIGLTNYKTLFFGLPVLVLFFCVKAFSPNNWSKEIKRVLADGIWIAVISTVLCLPWIMHLFSHIPGTVLLSQGKAGDNYYSLIRMGEEVLGFQTTLPLLVVSLFGAVLGLLVKNRNIILMVVWILVAFILSNPHLLGNYLDPISTLISMYLPISVLIVFPLVYIAERDWKCTRILNGVMVAAFLGMAVFGIGCMQKFIQIERTFPKLEDVQAAEWIKENIPDTALFMINTYNFDYSPKAIIGLDGGYWIPVLAAKKTIVPPINTSIEYQPMGKDILSSTLELHSLKGQLTTTDAIDLLKKNGVTHIYSGESGGPINVDALLGCAAYQLIYHRDNVFIFKLIE